MDKPLNQAEGEDFSDRIAEIQREIGESITKAGLQRDSYRYVLDVQSRVIGLFPELVANIAVTRQPLNDEEVLRKIVAGVSAANANMAVGEVSRAVDRLAIQRYRWWMCGYGVLVVLALLGGAALDRWVLPSSVPVFAVCSPHQPGQPFNCTIKMQGD
jgi:hypothetical protein